MTAFFLTLPFWLAASIPSATAPAVTPPPAEPAVTESPADPALAVENTPEPEASVETSEPEIMPESPVSFPAPDTTWALSEIDGTPFDDTATLTFPEPGSIAGKAPCNSFSGKLDGTPADFTVGPLAMTRMMCPNLDKETSFSQSLASMTQAEITPDQLILTGPDGHQMLFLPSK